MQFYWLIGYLILTYILGLLVLLLLFKDIFKKSNLFINLGLSWSFGVTVLMIIYIFLAFSNNLSFINQKNFIIFSMLMLLVTILVLIKYWNTNGIRFDLINLIIFFLIIVFFLPLISRSLLSYQDSWDPIAIWFLKAKVFFYSDGVWNNEFFRGSFYEYSHKAYPIGFPLLISGFFRIINNTNDQIIQMYLLSFYLNIIGIFYGFMKDNCKSFSQVISLLLTIFLFTLPNYAIYGFSGYVDVPLSLIILITTVFFIYLLEEKNTTINFDYLGIICILCVSGMIMKNEGYSFFIITIVSTITTLFFKRILLRLNFSMRRLILMTVIFLVCILPILMWEYFKRQYNIGLDLENVKIYANMLYRGKTIINSYIDEITNVSKYSLSLMIVFLTSILTNTYLLFNKKFKLIVPLMIVLLQLLVYNFIYLVTPLPLKYHLHSSLERLLLHLLPAFFLLIVYQLNSIIKILKVDK